MRIDLVDSLFQVDLFQMLFNCSVVIIAFTVFEPRFFAHSNCTDSGTSGEAFIVLRVFSRVARNKVHCFLIIGRIIRIVIKLRITFFKIIVLMNPMIVRINLVFIMSTFNTKE